MSKSVSSHSVRGELWHPVPCWVFHADGRAHSVEFTAKEPTN
jgi:hypothetical protein